jgi:hypothetical protein
MMPLKSEISITYIPASDAAVFKATAITRLGSEAQPEQVKKEKKVFIRINLSILMWKIMN